MHRVLIDTKIGGLHVEIMSYSFFMFLAIATVIILGHLISKKQGLASKQSLLSILIMGLGMMFGSRVLYALNHWAKYRNNPGRLFDLQFADFSLYGGLAIALLGGILACKVLKVNVWRLMDSLAPALGVGIALIRTGCFLNGCCFGRSTSVFWAVRFPFGSSAYNYGLTENIDAGGIMALFQEQPALHPTQLYELIAALTGALIATLIMRKKLNDGVAFLSFALWFTAFRWIDNGFRVDGLTGPVPPAWQYPVIYGALLITGTIVLVWRMRSPSKMKPVL